MAEEKTPLEEVAGYKLQTMLDYVKQLKAEGKDSVLYPWYVPHNPRKYIDDFKKYIVKGLAAKKIYITDFLEGQTRAEINGKVEHVFICWTVKAKKQAEAEGMVFKTYE